MTKAGVSGKFFLMSEKIKKSFILILVLALYTAVYADFESNCLAPLSLNSSPVYPRYKKMFETRPLPANDLEMADLRTLLFQFELDASPSDHDLLRISLEKNNPGLLPCIQKIQDTIITPELGKKFANIRSIKHPGNISALRYFSQSTKAKELKTIRQMINFSKNPAAGKPAKPILFTLTHMNPDIDTITSTLSLAYLFRQLKDLGKHEVFPVVDGKRENLNPIIEFLLLSAGIHPDNLIYYEDYYDENGNRSDAQHGFCLKEVMDNIENLKKTVNLTDKEVRDRYFSFIAVDHNMDMSDKRLLPYMKGIVDHHNLASKIKEKNMVDEGFQEINKLLMNPSTHDSAAQALVNLEKENRRLSKDEKMIGSELQTFNTGLFRNKTSDYFSHWRLTGCCATLVSELFEINRKKNEGRSHINYPPILEYLLYTAIHIDTEWLTSDRYSTFFDGKQKQHLDTRLSRIEPAYLDTITAIKDRYLYIDFSGLTTEEAISIIKRDSKDFTLDVDGYKATALLSSIDISSFKNLNPQARQVLFAAMKQLVEKEHLIYLGIRWASWETSEQGKSKGEQQLWSFSSTLFSPSVSNAIQRNIYSEQTPVTAASLPETDELGINMVVFPSDKPQRKQLNPIIIKALWDEIIYNNRSWAVKDLALKAA